MSEKEAETTEIEFLSLESLSQGSTIRVGGSVELEKGQLQESNLLAVSNKFGWAVVSHNLKLLFFRLDELRATLKQAESHSSPNASPRQQLSIPHAAISIKFAYSDKLVIASLSNGSILAWRLKAVVEGDSNPFFSLQAPFACQDVLPNPAPGSPLVALVPSPFTPNAQLGLLNLESRSISSPFPEQVQATCASWSVKGKQIVVGTRQGIIVQMTPEGEVKAEIPAPSTLAQGTPWWIRSLLWLENHVFLVVYAKAQQPDALDHDDEVYIINRSPSGTFEYVHFFDPVPAFGMTERQGRRWFAWIKQWAPLKHILLSVNAPSIEIGAIGQQDGWANYDWPELSRPMFPPSSTGEDSCALGFDLDLTATDSSIPHALLYTSDGILAIWQVKNSTTPTYPAVRPSKDVITQEDASDDVEGTAVAAPSAPTPAATQTPSSNPFSAFSAAPATSAFGTPTKPVPAAPAFGSSTFGSSPFGAAKPAFGASAFGSSSFGASSAAPSTPASTASSASGGFAAFGASSGTPSFGSTSAFPTSSSPFGSGSTFGASTFGSKPSPFATAASTPATSSSPTTTSTGFAGFGASATSTAASSGFGAFAKAAPTTSAFGAGGSSPFGSFQTSKPAFTASAVRGGDDSDNEEEMAAEPEDSGARVDEPPDLEPNQTGLDIGATMREASRTSTPQPASKAQDQPAPSPFSANSISFGGFGLGSAAPASSSSTSMFGTPASSSQASTATPATSSPFGAFASSTSTASPSVPAFGSTADKSASSAPSSSPFASAATSATTASTTSTPAVASAPASAPASTPASTAPAPSSTAFSFGGASAAPSTSSAFGSSPFGAFGASKSAFGSTAPSTGFSFGAPSTPKVTEAPADAPSNDSQPDSKADQASQPASDTQPSGEPQVKSQEELKPVIKEEETEQAIPESPKESKSAGDTTKEEPQQSPSAQDRTEVAKSLFGLTGSEPAASGSESPSLLSRLGAASPASPPNDDDNDEDYEDEEDHDESGPNTDEDQYDRSGDDEGESNDEEHEAEDGGNTEDEEDYEQVEASQDESREQADKDESSSKDEAKSSLFSFKPTPSVLSPSLATQPPKDKTATSEATSTPAKPFFSFTSTQPKKSSPLSQAPSNFFSPPPTPGPSQESGPAVTSTPLSFSSFAKDSKPATSSPLTFTLPKNDNQKQQPFSFAPGKKREAKSSPAFSFGPSASAPDAPKQSKAFSAAQPSPSPSTSAPPAKGSVDLSKVPRLGETFTSTQPPVGKEVGMGGEFVKAYVLLQKEFEVLRTNTERCRDFVKELKQPADGASAPSTFDSDDWSFGDLRHLKAKTTGLKPQMEAIVQASQQQRRRIAELQAMLLRAETKREEASRFIRARDDPVYAKLVRVRQLGPEHQENQKKIRLAIESVRSRLEQLEQHIAVLKSKVADEKLGLTTFRAPTLDTVNRTVRNITAAVSDRSFDIDDLALRLESIKMNTPVKSKVARRVTNVATNGSLANSDVVPTVNHDRSASDSSNVQKALQARNGRLTLKKLCLELRKEAVLTCENDAKGRSNSVMPDLQLAFSKGPITGERLPSPRRARTKAEPSKTSSLSAATPSSSIDPFNSATFATPNWMSKPATPTPAPPPNSSSSGFPAFQAPMSISFTPSAFASDSPSPATASGQASGRSSHRTNSRQHGNAVQLKKGSSSGTSDALKGFSFAKET